ncbi:C-8 sterol isomerases [Olea europaea subsp. europaea]|uniref:C-8 sterol isomerases n=1 Tax=Olea europaea subsp. europaea TaxID=158383 RepID=A0A8S0T4M0_OLEEU|nr:C-8 sterol isomerases [Olea europaea subsp. europaea]
MKSISTTPNSSLKSTTTIELNQSETRDSYYFPGCRKDASCKCEICIASINSTLDLMPQSASKSSFTKIYPSKQMIPRSPVSVNKSSLLLSTPKSKSSVPVRSFSASPPLNSTARTSFQEKIKRRKRDLGYGVFMVRLILGFIIIFAAEYGFSCMVYGVLKPKLSSDIVKNLGEKSWVFKDFNERLLFLKNELQGFVDNKVSTCVDSVWKINQDGLLLNSRYTLYKSSTEEVSIWGWPLQTAGLLTAEFSSRSFTVISGRVTEWSNGGELRYLMKKANSSWTQGKWSANAVQFDPNTWLLEYRRHFLIENARLVSASMEFLKFRLVREIERMKQEFWLLYAFGTQFADYRVESSPIPT